MLAGQERRRHFLQENAFQQIRQTIMATIQEKFVPKGNNTITDPIGPAVGINRVVRGGSWNDDAWDVRSASRNWDSPTYNNNYIGFRVARDF